MSSNQMEKSTERFALYLSCPEVSQRPALTASTSGATSSPGDLRRVGLVSSCKMSCILRAVVPELTSS